MRCDLLGDRSPLWRHREVALTIAASLPRGDESIVARRSTLRGLIFGDGWCNLFTVAPVQILHCQTPEFINDPNAVFVGMPNGRVTITPWVDPTVFVPCSPYNSFAKYAAARADQRQWLSHLSGKTLICNCSHAPGACHAYHLRHLVLELRGERQDVHILGTLRKEPQLAEVVDERLVDSIGQWIEQSGFQPSRGRSAEGVGSMVSAGRQPTRRSLPQLIQDGLPPDEHLATALRSPHPFQFSPTVYPPIDYAVQFHTDKPDALETKRFESYAEVARLAEMLDVETAALISMCEEGVRSVLCSGGFVKHVALMREIGFVVGTPDWGAVPALLVGLRAMGTMAPVPAMMIRVRSAECSIDDFWDARACRNEAVMRMVRPSGDHMLDALSMKKSLEEVDRGVLLGPWPVSSPLPGNLAIARRAGIWEQHGGSLEPSVRVIDDLLLGEQNSTVASSTTHKPADTDAIASQARKVQECRTSGGRTGGYTSDFAKAFKQIPGHPSERHMMHLVQWDPITNGAVMFVTLCQLFGGRAGPQNFSRYPAWLCYTMAVLFALASMHCVDDIIVQEHMDTIESGWHCWRAFATLLGWDVPDSKSPMPSCIFQALGVIVDHTQVPHGPVFLRITEARVEQLRSIISECLARKQLGPGEAGSLAGKLGFTTGQMFGRFGRAMLRGLYRRQHETRWSLNVQIVATLRWWLHALHSHVPRQVPVSIFSLPVYVSYSDGEGDTAGVGVALWAPGRHGDPLAAFCKVPREVRLSWKQALDIAPTSTDIFEIEAIGPLMVLHLWGDVLRGRLWVHYIDNEGAQAILVKGASSVRSGQVISGYFWEQVASMGIFVWLDRVASASNPVDGLSRGDFSGFKHVQRMTVPQGLIHRLRQCMW